MGVKQLVDANLVRARAHTYCSGGVAERSNAAVLKTQAADALDCSVLHLRPNTAP